MQSTSLPLSVNRFCRSHFHRRTSSSVTTRLTSSSDASLPSFTQAESGQPTRPTSPSVIHSFQKSSKQGRQNTWEHDSSTHRAPLIDVRQISQLYDVCENRACCIELSCSSSRGSMMCGARCGILKYKLSTAYSEMKHSRTYLTMSFPLRESRS